MEPQSGVSWRTTRVDSRVGGWVLGQCQDRPRRKKRPRNPRNCAHKASVGLMVSDGSSELGYEMLISVRRRVPIFIRLLANHVARRSPKYVVLDRHEQESIADLTLQCSREMCVRSSLTYLIVLTSPTSPICSQCAAVSITCQYPQMNKR